MLVYTVSVSAVDSYCQCVSCGQLLSVCQLWKATVSVSAVDSYCQCVSCGKLLSVATMQASQCKG